jgi:hypothetical protein
MQRRSPTLKDIALMYEVIPTRSHALPSYPVRITPLTKSELAAKLAKLQLTKGSTLKEAGKCILLTSADSWFLRGIIGGDSDRFI